MRLRRSGRGCLTAIAVLAACLCLGAAGTSASTVTLPGAPLSVSVGSHGECQSSYANAGNNFFPGEGSAGDCGFFLGFPEAGNPAALGKSVYGFAGARGPGLGATEYTPLSSGVPSGSGTAGDPYKLITTFKVTSASSKLDYLLVTETTTYVNGEAQFTSTFGVQNVTGTPAAGGLKPAPAAALRFHAIYAGDLSTDESELGAGVLLGGPPRMIGGEGIATGVLGGFVEAPAPSPPWSDYETGCWNSVPEALGRCPLASPLDGGIWAAVRAASSPGRVFNDDVDPNPVDDAAGVSWENSLSPGLEAGAQTTYSIINRAELPAPLSVQPPTQTHTVGQSATLTVTATNNVGTPYAGRPLVYSSGGANPKTGSVTTNASGVATISYLGTAAGLDVMQMYLDLSGTGSQIRQDPASAAQLTWLRAPAGANSGYRIRSVHAGSDGRVTITLVPVQAGTAAVEVTVPSAAIAGQASAPKCGRARVRIKGRCVAATSVSGKLSAAGRAGVGLKLTVNSSHAVRAALKRGRKLQLTARLTYRSLLGGKPAAQTFHLAVKPARKKKR
jgi:hypothetical protein